MTNTTTLDARVEDRRTFLAPAVSQPGLMTFLSQGALGWAFGCYVWLVGYILVYFDSNSFFFGMGIPYMLAMGTVIGSPVGLILWAFAKASDRPLSRTLRATIAVLLLLIGYIAMWLLFMWEPLTSERQLGVALIVALPGIMIGLFAGSSLRPGRELVRAGEAKLVLPRILAVITGLVLRSVVVQLFLASVIMAISALQYFYLQEPPLLEEWDEQWIPVAFFHFLLAMIVLFARMRTEFLAVLTAIANAPVIASFWMYPDMPTELWYALVGYLVAWALFLLSRWRLTDVAVAVLNDEIRYYLLD